MTDHELNKVLADVAGVEVVFNHAFHDQNWYVLSNDPIPLPTGERWTPLTDHNQMALVKAGLREKGYEYSSQYGALTKLHMGTVYKNDYTEMGVVVGLGVWNEAHVEELRAFGEAIMKMKESNG